MPSPTQPPLCPVCHTPQTGFIDRSLGGKTKWQRMTKPEREALIRKMNAARKQKTAQSPQP